MPTYNNPLISFSINRQAMMLDTNILVAAFLVSDDFHEAADYFLNEWDDPFVVPLSVLVESWGMLAGSFKNRDAASSLYQWAASPGNVSVFPDNVASFGLSLEMIDKARVDAVDAFIAQLAHDISVQCKLNPPMRIATLDTKDIIKCRVKFDLQIDLFDLRTYDEY